MLQNYQTLLTSLKEKVLTITLNRPQVHNAMNAAMIAELTEIFKNIPVNGTVRTVVLKGNGKSFCAGADINYMKTIATFGFEDNVADGEKLAALFMAIYQCPVPTIAMVHGVAFGGANGLLAACDVVIAEENTRFAFSEVKLGIAPATIGPFVIKRIGEYGAKELMLTGKRFTAEEAKSWKLVNYSLPQEKTEEKLQNMLNEFKTAAPQAVQKTKQMIKKIVSDNDIKETLNYTAGLIAELRASQEGQEGMEAFLEKRKPEWTK